MRIEDFLESFDKRVEYIRRFNIPQSTEYYFDIMRNYYLKVINAKRENRPLAWVSVMSPVELFHAMDIVPFVADTYAISVTAMLYFKGDTCKYFDIGDAYGFPQEACSPHRVCVGMAKEGILPPPDLMYSSTPLPCDSAVMLFDVLSNMYKCPTFFLNFEYRHHDDTLDHLKHELMDLITFLEETTGKKLDYERLKEVLEISRIANNFCNDIHQLRRRVPCPLRPRDAWNSFGIRVTSEGLPETIKFFETQYQEVKGRVDRQEGVIPEERHRLVVNGAYPFFYMDLLDWMQEEYKAIIVADLFNSYPMEWLGNPISDPIDFLAKKTLAFLGLESLFGTVEDVIDKLAESWRTANLDGSIYFTHFGCKQGCGINKIIRDKIMEKIGLPTLILDMDIGDPKVTSAAKMKSRLDEYLQMLEK